MNDVKIIRNDRGLDFRRIEQFIKMFHDKFSRKSSAIDRQKKDAEEKLKAGAFERYGLSDDIKAIKEIDIQIDLLKKQQKKHEDRIRDFTQGTDKNSRYSSYDNIRENSPIQKFINAGLATDQKKREEVWALNQELSNELWYARDLEEAIVIVRKFEGLLDGISLEEVKIER